MADGEITGAGNYFYAFHLTTQTRLRGWLGELGLATQSTAATAARRNRARRHNGAPATRAR